MWYQSDTIHDVAMTLRTDDELDAAMAALADAEGVSKQEVVRRAVLEKYERDGHRVSVDRVVDEMLDRWGDVLERLSKA